MSQKALVGYFKPGSATATEVASGKVFETQFEVIGQGSDGALNFKPQFLNFEDVKVNFNKKVHILNIQRQFKIFTNQF